MKSKNQILLETHGDRDLNIVLVHKAMAIYASQFQKEWVHVDDNLPETSDFVLIWRYGMPYVGKYDINHNWWAVDGVADIADVEYWKEITKP